MRNGLLVAAASFVTISARILHSLPEDTFAFPKFRVAFLNGLPVLNETAERWLKEGLRGGIPEFLDEPWKADDYRIPSHLKEIDSGTHESVASSPDPLVSSDAENYTLEHMKMGPRDSYICLIPKPLENIPPLEDDDSDADVTPARSWSLLQPLAGTCLYHRQGWFTYSYCHNDEIRQFKELIPAQSRYTGTYKPEEDPEWDAYTLGRAPTAADPGADLTVAEQNAHASVELARGGGSRYLVQRWSDGTICDKTGKSREVEVQFHCSMESSDHVLFVKETKTCSYVLVVHTPRLCGEPGFKSRRDAGEEAQIRCREVVDMKSEEQMQLPTTDHPVKIPLRKTVLPAPKAVPKGEKIDGSMSKDKEKAFDDLLRKTLDILVNDKNKKAHAGKGRREEQEEIVLEFEDDSLEEMNAESDRLVEALRAAGYDVRAEVITIGGEKKIDNKKKPAGKKIPHPPGAHPHRDEL